MRRYPILGIAAHLTNNGSRPRTLVLPGDGSCRGWPTPVIEWRFQPSRDDCRVTSNQIEVDVENADLDWADPR
jgi:hypothetical protein